MKGRPAEMAVWVPADDGPARPVWRRRLLLAGAALLLGWCAGAQADVTEAFGVRHVAALPDAGPAWWRVLAGLLIIAGVSFLLLLPSVRHLRAERCRGRRRTLRRQSGRFLPNTGAARQFHLSRRALFLRLVPGWGRRP